jgi:hypothetical protein
MDMKERNVTNIGHQTTIDTTRAKSTTLSSPSLKRSAGDAFGESVLERRTINQPAQQNPPHSRRHPNLEIGQCPSRLNASILRNCSSTDPAHIPSTYSRLPVSSALPTSTTNPLLSLSHPAYGLPEKLISNFSSLGIKSIYQWQSDCLLQGSLLSGDGNLIYVAPTGGGKSLVADILMLRKIMSNPGKKGILVLPFVALVQEKLRWFRSLVDGLVKQTPLASCQEHQLIWRSKGNENSVRIAGFIGGSKSRIQWDDMDMAICTIEKVRRKIVIHSQTIQGKCGTLVLASSNVIAC